MNTEAATAARQAQYSRTHVPARLFVPVVRGYIDRYQRLIGAERGQRENVSPGEFNAGKQGAWNTADALVYESAIRVLATEANICEDTLTKYLSGRRKWIDFNIADRLLCAMNAVHLWWVEPLSDVYWTLELDDRLCARPGCDRRVVSSKNTPKTGPKRKKFCTAECRRLAAA